MKRNRQTQRTARGAAALATAAALALTLAACGSDSSGKAGRSTTGSPTAATPDTGTGGAPAGAQAPEALATIKGPAGILITITSAKRDQGGFVTVNGSVRNTGDQPFTQAANWRGDEEALVKNGGSLAGATLVDLQAKKRYYVLRDTEGRCLCTTGLDIIRPGDTVPLFAQFPAPPATTTQVDLDVPTLPTAAIVISR